MVDKEADPTVSDITAIRKKQRMSELFEAEYSTSDWDEDLVDQARHAIKTGDYIRLYQLLIRLRGQDDPHR